MAYLRTKEFVIPGVYSTGFRKHSVRYLGPLLWSKLDGKVREQQSVDAFKKLIRKQNLAALIFLPMTAKIAYCAILRISFVIEYVYILLVFYDIGFINNK